MNTTPDYTIVGAGPAGLTLAWYLSRYGGARVLLLDRESTLGGCHRVRRVTDAKRFTEHGPRVYSDAYVNFRRLWRDMGFTWDDYFVRYRFDLQNIGGQTFFHLKPREIVKFVVAYGRMTFIDGGRYARTVSVNDWMNKHHFTDASKDYIDRMCRLTDGAGASRYTLFELLQLPNQHLFYKLYQPRAPNDEALFADWSVHVANHPNVDIESGAHVTSLQTNQTGNRVTSLTIRDTHGQLREIPTQNVILAIPPRSLMELLQRSTAALRDAFGPANQLSQWVGATRYNVYVPITLRWTQPVHIPPQWGFPISDWGVIFVVLTDYMVAERDSSVVVSIAITKMNSPSSVTGLTAHQTKSRQALMQETLRQLWTMAPFAGLPRPTSVIVSPGVYRTESGHWETVDASFVLTPAVSRMGYLAPQHQSPTIRNLYSVGTHNGQSPYHFTSMESAVANALSLSQQLVPQVKREMPTRAPWSADVVLRAGVIVAALLFMAKVSMFQSS